MVQLSKSIRGVIAAAGVAFLISIAGAAWLYGLREELKEPLAQIPFLNAQSLSLATEVFDRHGEKIGEFSEERRYFVGVSELPKHVIQAFISAEDKHFYEHKGISPASILRASIANLKVGGIRQGASTITQQLARIYFLNQEKSLSRKIKEAFLALELERKLSKEKILELYLNAIYLGMRSYGIESAARNFFRKNAAQLTVSEAAMLAALPKSPAIYSPQRHRKQALERRAWVLLRMAEDGYLSKAHAIQWAKSPLSVSKSPEDHWARAPYFLSAVRRDLDRKFELHGLPRHGLRVYTTLDAKLQRMAEKNLQRQLVALEKTFLKTKTHFSKDRFEGALVILDSKTGSVLAMQGGRHFRRSQFNRVAEARRPMGSLLHPFLLAMALERGISPLAPIPSANKSLSTPSQTGRSLSPALMELLLDEEDHGWEALPSLLGYGSVGDLLHRLRLKDDGSSSYDPTQNVPVTPLQVGLSYSSLVNGGYVLSSHIVRRVEDREGRMLFNAEGSFGLETPIFDPKVAFATRELLAFSSGSHSTTAINSQLPQTTSTFGRSKDGRDLWFVGFMPSAVSVLWLGSEHGKISLPRTRKDHQLMASLFWSDLSHAFNPRITSEPLFFVPPDGIAYVRIPGVDGRSLNVPLLSLKETMIENFQF